MRARRLIQAAALGTGALLALAVLPTGSAAAKSSPNVPCSGQAALVSAIEAANSAGGGTLNLAAGCDYALTTPNNSENGLPVITTAVNINGHGATIDGTGTVRVLAVEGPGGKLSLRNVTLTHGSAEFGGAVENNGGTVTLNRTQVTSNAAKFGGGGIASATFDPSSVAVLALNNSTVSENQQTAPPPEHEGEHGGIGGGGILTILGKVSLNGTQVNENTAQGAVGGGIANGDYLAFSRTGSVLTLNRSEVDGNSAPNAGGGGIQNLLGSTTLNNTHVDGNTSKNGAGISSGPGFGAPPASAQLKLNNSEVDENTATSPPGGGPPIAGGGVANGGVAALNNSEVDGNKAKHTSGAGIVNHGTMTLNNSDVDGNAAEGSGAIASGGGIINAATGEESGILTLNNTRVNNNKAGGDGGGIANGLPPVGPMPLFGGAVTLHNSQVTGNEAAHGGGIFNHGGTVNLSNTTVTANTPDNCEPPSSIAGCTG